MSLSEEYLTSFTFSIFLEDITTELQLKRCYSEQTHENQLNQKNRRLSISTDDSINHGEAKKESFKLSKFCPNFETFRSNGEFMSLGFGGDEGESGKGMRKVKNEFYENLVRKINKIVG